MIVIAVIDSEIGSHASPDGDADDADDGSDAIPLVIGCLSVGGRIGWPVTHHAAVRYNFTL
jgi:hypothetical protein